MSNLYWIPYKKEGFYTSSKSPRVFIEEHKQSLADEYTLVKSTEKYIEPMLFTTCI